MPESNHDDLADALSRLAGGDVAPSEQEPPAPPLPDARRRAAPAPPLPEATSAAPSAAPRAIRPASTRPTAPKPPVPARPSAPVPGRPAAPAPPAIQSPPAPIRPVRPTAPALTSQAPAPATRSAAGATPPAGSSPAPTIRQVVPVVRKARPAAPTLAAPKPPVAAPSTEEIDGGQSTGLSAEADPGVIVDDDDLRSIPAPDASVFEPRSKPAVSEDFKAKATARKNLEFRRTLIPILLTCGVMMLGFASLKFLTGSDSMLATVPLWVPILLILAGLILIGLGVVNMLSVKAQLSPQA